MIGTPSQLLAAQLRWDDMAEPEGDESDGLIESIRIAMVRCEETLGRADRALDRGDTDAAQDLLRPAINELEELATARSDA